MKITELPGSKETARKGTIAFPGKAWLQAGRIFFQPRGTIKMFSFHKTDPAWKHFRFIDPEVSHGASSKPEKKRP